MKKEKKNYKLMIDGINKQILDFSLNQGMGSGGTTGTNTIAYLGG